MFVRRHDERGIAMTMTVVIIMIAASLAAVILIQGSNTERHSGRGKNWNEALQAADAGVQAAIARLQADNGLVPALQPITGNTADGAYSVTVQRLPRGRYRIESSGTAGRVQGLKSERHIRAILAPPVSFEYALFSLKDVSTKNINYVEGDVWANGSVTVLKNDTIDGDVFAANGWLVMESGSTITGDVQTGSYNPADDVAMQIGDAGGGATVKGNVKASSTAADCEGGPGKSKYKILGGIVEGNAVTVSNGVGSTVVGTTTTGLCTQAPNTKQMPFFDFDPTRYDPAPWEGTVSQFQTLINMSPNLQGVYHVTGDGMVDLSGTTIVADTTIIADTARIWTNGVDANTGGQDTLFILVSGYKAQPGDQCTSSDDASGNPSPEDCAIGLKNNFDPTDDNIATLVYAPLGPVAFKNTGDFNGAVYGTDIVLKNTMNITYDGRVDRVLGFGPVTYERESWVELPK
jgi:hypothetical protein